MLIGKFLSVHECKVEWVVCYVFMFVCICTQPSFLCSSCAHTSHIYSIPYAYMFICVCTINKVHMCMYVCVHAPYTFTGIPSGLTVAAVSINNCTVTSLSPRLVGRLRLWIIRPKLKALDPSHRLSVLKQKKEWVKAWYSDSHCDRENVATRHKPHSLLIHFFKPYS
jgi:hypothetical protein